MRKARFPLSLLGLLSAGLVACSSTQTSYIVLGGSDAPQKPLVLSIAKAESEAIDARAGFGEAFELFQRLSSPQAVDLEGTLEAFEDAFEVCQDSAEDLEERIQGAREETETLVQGWNAELERFSSKTLRAKSAAMLEDTEGRARRVLVALERLEGRMQPVLAKLQDYALFFHHNLSARAIATLEDTYRDFDGESRALEAEFDKARTELGAFLEHFTRKRVEAPAE